MCFKKEAEQIWAGRCCRFRWNRRTESSSKIQEKRSRFCGFFFFYWTVVCVWILYACDAVQLKTMCAKKTKPPRMVAAKQKHAQLFWAIQTAPYATKIRIEQNNVNAAEVINWNATCALLASFTSEICLGLLQYYSNTISLVRSMILGHVRKLGFGSFSLMLLY